MSHAHYTDMQTSTGKALSAAFLAIDPDRHRTIINQPNFHAGAEYASPDGSSRFPFQLKAEFFIAFLGKIGRSGFQEGWAVALTCVGEERELTNY